MISRKNVCALAMLALLGACDRGGGDSAQNTTAAAGNTAVAEGPVTLEVPAGVYKNDPLHSSLQWSVPHFGMSHYNARFTKYGAEITLDPADISKSKITLTVDPTSVRTDYPDEHYKEVHGDRPFRSWDDELGAGDRWFNSRKFATVTFTSTKVERSGPRSAKVTGDLTFLGQTKPVVMDVTLVGQRAGSGNRPPTFGVHAEGEFDRTTYGMKVGAAGAPVKVAMDAEFILQGAAGS